MYDALLLESVEGLDDNALIPDDGQIWNSLQDLKEEVAQELITEGPLCHADSSGLLEDEVSEAGALEIEMLRREQLSAQLNDITHAQDRLMDGTYGKCEECGEDINIRRLVANPSAALCFDCQTRRDGDQQFRSL